MDITLSSTLQERFSELIDVWESSVRATHHFLEEEHIAFFKPLLITEYFKSVALWHIQNSHNRIMGFLGLSDSMIEMLFIHPDFFGQGIGKKLAHFAINEKGVTRVGVNEQNEQAVGFYHHLGFKTIKRSEKDGLGLPFPILHMELPTTM
jgi:putative acetyltransferase